MIEGESKLELYGYHESLWSRWCGYEAGLREDVALGKLLDHPVLPRTAAYWR